MLRKWKDKANKLNQEMKGRSKGRQHKNSAGEDGQHPDTEDGSRTFESEEGEFSVEKLQAMTHDQLIETVLGTAEAVASGAHLKMEFEELKEVHALLKEEVQLYKNQTQTMQSEMQKSSQMSEELKKENHSLKEQLVSTASSVGSGDDKEKRSDGDPDVESPDSSTFKSPALLEKELEVEDLTKRLELLTKDSDELKLELKSYKNNIELLQKEAEESMDGYNRVREENDQYKQKQQILEESCKDLTEKSSSYQENLDDLRKEYRGGQQKTLEYEQKIEELEKFIEEAQATNTGFIKALEDELAGKKSHCDRLEEINSKEENRLSDMEARFGENKQLLQQRTQEIESLRKLLEEKSTQIETKNDDLYQLREERNKEKNEFLEELQKKDMKLQEVLTANNQNKIKDFELLQQKNEEYNELITKHNQEQIKVQEMSRRISELEASNQSITLEVETLRAKSHALEEDNQALKSSLGVQQKKRESGRQEVLKLVAKVEELEKQRDKLNREKVMSLNPSKSMSEVRDTAGGGGGGISPVQTVKTVGNFAELTNVDANPDAYAIKMIKKEVEGIYRELMVLMPDSFEDDMNAAAAEDDDIMSSTSSRVAAQMMAQHNDKFILLDQRFTRMICTLSEYIDDLEEKQENRGSWLNTTLDSVVKNAKRSSLISCIRPDMGDGPSNARNRPMQRKKMPRENEEY
eukprot:CAMPEP_0115004294 /NCGR_PEP_ID=MMETSP0216-20121206/19109_1 /TAXON_ID=223996 /ORGANISM="Protocruzia adherens, Strain Boccale" /LENGTH=692 /DNA_ID=CAMNT_0002370239 /DNA_START=36 /DNA_END=2114 /DNA_ORIENTATION=+